jgi:hypothetical protein
MWGGSGEAVSEFEIRSEGPLVSKPGRQAGNGFVGKISAEGAAQQRVSRVQRSFNPLIYPGLTAGPTDWRPFGPVLCFIPEY